MSYRIRVWDNFHYMDEDEAAWHPGSWESAEEAIAVAKKMVDDFLLAETGTAPDAEALYDKYTSFGEDPSVVGPAPCGFSAWTYARERCAALYAERP